MKTSWSWFCTSFSKNTDKINNYNNGLNKYFRNAKNQYSYDIGISERRQQVDIIELLSCSVVIKIQSLQNIKWSDMRFEARLFASSGLSSACQCDNKTGQLFILNCCKFLFCLNISMVLINHEHGKQKRFNKIKENSNRLSVFENNN